MNEYTYNAMDEAGAYLSGVLEAESPEEANLVLCRRGLVPCSVSERGSAGTVRGSRGFSFRRKSVSARDLILFTKQIRTMLRAGIPVIKLLDVIENQTENQRLKSVTGSLAEEVTRGASLSEAFGKYPYVFSPLYCSMISAGEESGALPDVLDRLVYILEREAKLKADVRSALQYPILVVAALAVAFAVLFGFVIPRFARLFQQADLVLPVSTRICLFCSYLVVDRWYWWSIPLALALSLATVWLRTESGREARDRGLLAIPLVGPLMLKATMARFAGIFSILQSSGVTVLRSLEVLSKTVRNRAVSGEFERISSLLKEGHRLAETLSSSDYFPLMLVNMIAVGESSGSLEEMLQEAASHYDTEVEYAIEKLTTALGPILTVALAILVGFFALAVYMPMWDLANIVK